MNKVVLSAANFPGLVLTPTQATQLSFAPATTFSGNAGFTYTVADDAGLQSAAATYTIPVVAADVTTALTGPATISSGQPSGNYAAMFSNSGSLVANGVTQKVTLPAGATNVVLPAGATLSGSPIDFGAATLTVGASNSFVFSFTASSLPGSVNIRSNVTTTSNQGADAAANQATLPVTVNKSTPPTSCSPSYFDGTTVYSGLSAEYYSGYYANDPTYFNGKTPTQTRIESSLNYPDNPSFGDLTASGAGTDNKGAFSARYRGSLSVATAGSYTFYLSADNYTNLWLDGAALAPTANPPLAMVTLVTPNQ